MTSFFTTTLALSTMLRLNAVGTELTLADKPAEASHKASRKVDETRQGEKAPEPRRVREAQPEEALRSVRNAVAAVEATWGGLSAGLRTTRDGLRSISSLLTAGGASGTARPFISSEIANLRRAIEQEIAAMELIGPGEPQITAQQSDPVGRDPEANGYPGEAAIRTARAAVDEALSAQGVDAIPGATREVRDGDHDDEGGGAVERAIAAIERAAEEIDSVASAAASKADLLTAMAIARALGLDVPDAVDATDAAQDRSRRAERSMMALTREALAISNAADGPLPFGRIAD